MTTSPCESCGSTQFSKAFSVSDTNQGVEGTWDIAVCDTCGLGRVEPFPEREQIHTFYENVFYSEEGKRFHGPIEFLRRKLAVLRGRGLCARYPDGARLLDFGAGSGHFSAAMRDSGWKTVEIDPYSNAANKTVNCHMDEDTPVIDVEDDSFDVVTLWHVIEHMRAPKAALDEMFRILKPGGTLLLAQPNFASLQARNFGPAWLLLDPPRHLFQFAPGNLHTLAERTGFSYIQTTHGALEFGPYTIMQSLLNRIFGNTNDLFKLLKNNALKENASPASGYSLGKALASIALMPILGPLSFLAYFVLLGMKSGDTFTLYMRKPK